MAGLDPQETFEALRKATIKSISTHFPVEGKKRILRLKSVSVKDDNTHVDSVAKQKDVKLKGKTWGAPIYGEVELVDKATGKVIDSGRVSLGTLPKPTRRFSYIVRGEERQIHNQLRLKSGVYTKETQAGGISQEWNLSKGLGFSMDFDSDTKKFRIQYGTKSYPAYSILKTLGVDDEDLERTWGKEILNANRVTGRVETSNLLHLSQRLTGQSSDSLKEAQTNIRAAFDKTELRPDSTKLTLGKELKQVDGSALVLGSKKLLNVIRGVEEADERDQLQFKDVFGAEDHLEERISTRGRSEIQRKLKRKIDNADSVSKVVTIDTFGKAIDSFFSSSSVSDRPKQLNPMGFISGHRRTTIFGEGGILNENQFTPEAQSINPTQMGFLDPVQTPESSRIGGILQIALGAAKHGKELKTRVFNLKTKQYEWLNSEQANKAIIAFPDQYKKVGKDYVPRNTEVKVMDASNEVRAVSANKVQYVISSPKGMFDFSANSIPFLQNNQGNRTSVAAKQLEQSVALVDREEPLVQNKTDGNFTFEEVLGKLNSHTAPVDGQVIDVKEDRIIIQGTNRKKHEVELYKDFPLNDNKSAINSQPLVKVGDTVKKGQLVADTNFTRNGKLALGKNLEVSYMPYQGYNFEDGIVISETAAKKLTSEHMTRHSVQAGESTILDKNRFMAETAGQWTNRQSNNLDELGVVKKGTRVKPGDLLIAVLKKTEASRELQELQKISKSAFRPVKAQPVIWEADYEGEVVEVFKSGKDITVHVKSQSPVVIGDKLVGRHGNKGIVTHIVADNEMPHKQNGRPVDVLLNPAGISTRINLGQCLETAAGKIAQKTGKPYVVDNFNADIKDYTEKVLKDLKKVGISDKEKITDPRSGEVYETLTGPQYILKLEHMAEKGVSARNVGRYDSNMQPKQGGKASGVTMDSGGLYAMLAHGARENIREFQAIKGERNDDYWAALQNGEVPPAPETPFAYRKFVGYLKTMGVDVNKEGNKLHLGPLTDEQVLSMSNGEITKPDIPLKHSSANEILPEPGGLFDPKITGTTSITHGLGERWGHMKLTERLPNPTFEKPIRSLLGLTQKAYENVIAGSQKIDGATGPEAIVSALDKIDVSSELQKLEASVQGLKGPRLNDASRKIKYLRVLNERKLNARQAYTLQHIPVLPPKMRPVTVLDSGDIRTDDVTEMYRQLGTINTQLKDLQDLGVPKEAEEMTSLGASLYDGLKGLSLTGMEYKQRHRKGILELIGGKSGMTQPKNAFFQSKVIGKRQDMSMRGVIVPEPSLGMDEVALPESAAMAAYKPFVMRRMRQSGYAPGQAVQAIKDKEPIVYNMLEAEMKSRPVLLKRDPVLHKYGVQAFKPVLTKGSAIKIHPLATGGFNADFDGDKMAAFVPISNKAVDEAWKMLPSKNLFSSSHGGLMFRPTHESLLGLHQLTRTDGKKTGLVFQTGAAAAKAVKQGKIGITDVVTIRDATKEVPNFLQDRIKKASENKAKHTTVGRMLIEQSLPKEYKHLFKGQQLDKRNLTKLLSEIGQKADAETFRDVADTLKDMGNVHATGYGFGLEDFKAMKGPRDNILRQVKEREREIHKSVRNKAKRNEALAELYNKARIVLDKATKPKFDKSNNKMYQWVKAQARGNWDQFKQMTITPLAVVDSKERIVPISIEKSYSEGLDTASYWASMYGARKGTIGRVKGTQLPGAQVKEMMQTSMDHLVSEIDCGTKEGNMFSPTDNQAIDRVLAVDVSLKGKGVLKAGEVVTPQMLTRMQNNGVKAFTARTPLKCQAHDGVCSRCYGLNEMGQFPEKGDNLGVKAVHAIGEPLTQMAMNAFHTGGVAGAKGSDVASQFDRVVQLVKFPQNLPGSAVLSKQSGNIDKIEKDEVVGGWNIYVSGTKHYLSARQSPVVSKGQKVKKGDALSGGPKNPLEMLPLTGISAVRNYVTDELTNLGGYSRTPILRKNAEVFVRTLTNLAEIEDPKDHPTFLKGDKVAASEVNRYNSSVTKGEQLLARPILKGTNVLPRELRSDWLARMQATHLKDTILDGAAEGWVSDLHGTHPIPAAAFGLEFGQSKNPDEAWKY